MGFLDTILGRTKPARPNLDQLFAVPSAAITLQVAAGLTPNGLGAVCYKSSEGGEFARVQADVQALLDADDGPDVEVSTDNFGFTWLLVRHDPDDVAGLVTDLHAVNTALENSGFGPTLLCSIIVFHDDAAPARRLGLVYLYKRGTYYPFAPTGEHARDNALELQVRAQLGDDLKIEPDVGRWFPVWGAPGL
jgi:PspAB-like protein